MAFTKSCLIILLVSTSFTIDNTYGDWEFLKKNQDTASSTAASTLQTSTTKSTSPPRPSKPPRTSVNRGLVNAASTRLTYGTEASVNNVGNIAQPQELNSGIPIQPFISPTAAPRRVPSTANVQTTSKPVPLTAAPRRVPSTANVQTTSKPVPLTAAPRGVPSTANVQITSRPVSPTAAPRGVPSTANVQTTSRPVSPTAAPSVPLNPSIGQHQPGQSQIIHSTTSTIAPSILKTTTTTPRTTDQQLSPINPRLNKGNTVTDDDLKKLSESLFVKDSNNAWQHITLNLQKKTTSQSQVDESPQPLLKVNSAALKISTIDKVRKIYDNYHLNTKVPEYISPLQREEESSLLNTFLSTNVMSEAMRFLADKGFIKRDYYEYKFILRQIWFSLYSRGDGKIGSTGFEHVFMSELKNNQEVLGLHNWIYFSSEEENRHANYLGYTKKLDLGNKAAILKLHAQFNGLDKPTTTMFIGTSPELEMALYTVCFFVRPDQTCPLHFDGTKFNIITHKFRYRGKDVIGSAYPEI